jgi:mRNA-degrading endonuclease toxin of MazEF toxin-antitoxin module
VKTLFLTLYVAITTTRLKRKRVQLRLDLHLQTKKGGVMLGDSVVALVLIKVPCLLQ